MNCMIGIEDTQRNSKKYASFLNGTPFSIIFHYSNFVDDINKMWKFG